MDSRYIISKEKVRENKKEARSEAQLDKGINNETFACTYQYWNEALAFNKSKNILIEKHAKAIYDICINHKFFGRNSQLAIEALKLLREEGFKH